MKQGKSRLSWKWIRIQIIILLGLFIFVEVLLRIFGFRPGVVDKRFYVRDPHPIQYDSILYADSFGITHHLPTGQFINGQILNSEGYFSAIEYTEQSMDSVRNENKKIIMLVGDSYTQGCCASNYQKSFAALLNNRKQEVLNFGVGGTDPLHYRLQVERYVPELKPDVVVIAVYLGNDIMPYDRSVKPYVPVCYPVKNGYWISSEKPFHLDTVDTAFRNFNEVRQFYYKHYSLHGTDNSFFEKSIKWSVIFSTIYLKFKELFRAKEFWKIMPPRLAKPKYTARHLEAIRNYCASLNTPVIFAAIPSPIDIRKRVDLPAAYDFLFEGVTVYFPDDIRKSDYDGQKIGNHFKDSGHEKYANFLNQLIQLKLKSSKIENSNFEE